jgi:hypothetical protein
MTDNTFNFSAYVFPPLMVGLAVVVKDGFVDGYPLSSPVLLTDIGVNIVAYLLADVFVQFGLNKSFTNAGSGESILESGTDIVVQPVVHGLLCGFVRPMIHSKQTLITHPITFASSFIDGAVYNIVAKYLSSPLVIYFESTT